MSNPIKIKNISENVKIDVPRGISTTSSPNSSRELFIYSNLSFQLYTNRIKVENEKFSWDKQVES